MNPTAKTPQRSPAKRMAGITQAQKQALMDNLQLEITDRARKLRAQYALQAQGIRTRLEMRVNRIPQAVRKRNIQELIEEHHAKTRPAPAPPVPAAATTTIVPNKPRQAPIVQSTRKRKSDEISPDDDNNKENLPAPPPATAEIPNPMKRTKVAPPTVPTPMPATANSKAPRARNIGPNNNGGGVLSPKSHNSRTLPHSPIKHPAAEKPAAPPKRPISAQAAPVKPARAPSRQTKRPVTVMGTTTAASDGEGRASEASNTSSGTTIVTRPPTRNATVGKKTGTTTGAKAGVGGRKAAGVKVEAVVAPAAATRTLRKRN